MKAQENIKDRYRKLENEVEKIQKNLIDEWDESIEEIEIEKMIDKSIAELMKYDNKITETSRDNDAVIDRCYDIIDPIESSTQHAPITKFNHLDNTQIGKEKTNDKLVNPEADKFNYKIKLNNGTNDKDNIDSDNEDNVMDSDWNTEISYNVADNSSEEQAEITQLKEAKEKIKVLQARVHLYENATSCKDCDFAVSGKMKQSKISQKLQAH